MDTKPQKTQKQLLKLCIHVAPAGHNGSSQSSALRSLSKIFPVVLVHERVTRLVCDSSRPGGCRSFFLITIVDLADACREINFLMRGRHHPCKGDPAIAGGVRAVWRC